MPKAISCLKFKAAGARLAGRENNGVHVAPSPRPWPSTPRAPAIAMRPYGKHIRRTRILPPRFSEGFLTWHATHALDGELQQRSAAHKEQPPPQLEQLADPYYSGSNYFSRYYYYYYHLYLALLVLCSPPTVRAADTCHITPRVVDTRVTCTCHNPTHWTA